MSEGLVFSNPHEELEYLRTKVLEKERELERFGVEKERGDVIKDSIRQLENTHSSAIDEESVQRTAESLLKKHEEVEITEMMQITEEKGIVHALKVVEKLKGWRLEDSFHDFLVTHVAQGLPIPGLKEKGPIYQALHMTLYEVVLPKKSGGDSKPLTDLIRSMEQLYAGFLSIAGEGKNSTSYMAFEVANPEGEEDTRIFVSVPSERKSLFERELLSIFHDARVLERERDYNIFNEFGTTLGATARLERSPAYPLKTSESFSEDPLNVILTSLSNIPKDRAGAALQIIFKPTRSLYTERYKRAIEELKKGRKAKEVLAEASITKEFGKAFGEFFIGGKKTPDRETEKIVDSRSIESIGKKIESPIVETNIRLVSSASTEAEAGYILKNLEASFNQFENPGDNKFEWTTMKASKESEFYRAFTFRLWRDSEIIPLSLRELSTILHLHPEAISEHTSLVRQTSKSSGAPSDLVSDGTPLGVNRFQGGERKVYIGKDDRLRHFYTIGQTGTGKSTLLKNMVIDDIRRGEGVCMIDPHGSDIMEILGNVPEERMQDVIYFDPADVDRPMGLNMLEYRRERPEEKTFVVNELFSIFQKLYGQVPESMGPMFEQYFRNAALLAIDDPDSGSTLLDVSRLLSNRDFRNYKLSKTSNPVVIQFWKEIADKAGGEAALANIVPYITSKFDVFLANDIMRPIVASEKSAFDLREIMDQKKILLVNLAKGRLGDINANLLGLIIVGKILLAALSRVDSVGKDLPPFYLYIDEFQNITTNSISTILSEARKYKLSLNMAHQFIAQLEEGIKNAVFGNVGTICAFRVGADDAKALESQFAPTFSADDLQNVDNRKAYIRLLVNGRPVAPFDIETVASPKGNPDLAQRIINESRMKYGRSREEAEAEVRRKYEDIKKPEPAQAQD